jgi:hypothetical protein
MSDKRRIIKKEEYFIRLDQGIPVGDCWVDMGNGELAYALHEVAAIAVPYNKYNDREFVFKSISVCIADNTRVDNIQKKQFEKAIEQRYINQKIQSKPSINDDIFNTTELEDEKINQQERAPSSEYSIRSDTVGYKDLLSEFMEGTGPERSLFLEGHHMVEILKTSWILTIARTKYILENKNKLDYFDVPFGVVGAAVSTANLNMVEQFIGGARVTIISFSTGVYYQVDDTKNKSSLYLHMDVPNPDRSDGYIIPQSTTYQRYIWFEKHSPHSEHKK